MEHTGHGTPRPERESHRRSSPQLVSTDCTASRHGTSSAYTKFGCRCRAAIRDRKWQEYERAHGRPMTVDATGTIRRIRALQALGWPGRTIMAEAGWAGAALGSTIYQSQRVHRSTAERFAQLYDRLSDTPGPSARVSAHARRAGWLPPLWWDDDTIDDPAVRPISTPSVTVDPVVVERLLNGQPPLHVTKHERAEAVRLLDSRGATVSEISRRLHMSGSRVAQILAAVAPAADTHANNDRQEASA